MIVNDKKYYRHLILQFIIFAKKQKSVFVMKTL